MFFVHLLLLLLFFADTFLEDTRCDDAAFSDDQILVQSEMQSGCGLSPSAALQFHNAVEQMQQRSGCVLARSANKIARVGLVVGFLADDIGKDFQVLNVAGAGADADAQLFGESPELSSRDCVLLVLSLCRVVQGKGARYL